MICPNVFITPRVDGQLPDSWIISGNTGSGATTFARTIMHSFLTRNKIIQGLTKYQVSNIIRYNL